MRASSLNSPRSSSASAVRLRVFSSTRRARWPSMVRWCVAGPRGRRRRRARPCGRSRRAVRSTARPCGRAGSAGRAWSRPAPPGARPGWRCAAVASRLSSARRSVRVEIVEAVGGALEQRLDIGRHALVAVDATPLDRRVAPASHSSSSMWKRPCAWLACNSRKPSTSEPDRPNSEAPKAVDMPLSGPSMLSFSLANICGGVAAGDLQARRWRRPRRRSSPAGPRRCRAGRGRSAGRSGSA